MTISIGSFVVVQEKAGTTGSGRLGQVVSRALSPNYDWRVNVKPRHWLDENYALAYKESELEELRDTCN